MALTGSPDTDTSSPYLTLGDQALDYPQDVATRDEVLEQAAPEEAEEAEEGRTAGALVAPAGPAAPAAPTAPAAPAAPAGLPAADAPAVREAPAATEVTAEADAEETRRRPVTTPQIVGGILIAAIMVIAAVWYVPRIVRSDARSFTGTVSSSGVTNLNFANSGLVGKVAVQLGQAVKAGQVLATETSPSTIAAISADRASIAAGQASLAELKASGTQASIAAAGAQLAQDQAQLASDKVKLAETQIIAPSAGTVIAISGQTGETVTAAGIRSYASQSQASGSQSPPFSLLPEGPAANVKSSSSQSALPMIALRTSSSWQVTVLVPESGIQQVRAGQQVTVAVPAVGLSGVRGTIQQVSPTPVSTSIGTAYQAIVRISGHQRVTPLGGMTANVQLAS
jgi:multidrug efflux pump subunit AcrA (membrane-fusion protein)